MIAGTAIIHLYQNMQIQPKQLKKVIKRFTGIFRGNVCQGKVENICPNRRKVFI